MKSGKDPLDKILNDALNYQFALAEESDRAAAVLAAAYFEKWLRKKIIGRFEGFQERQKLIKRLLPNFASKINIGYLLGLYDRKIWEGLNTVRAIRNEFAHCAEPIKFNDNKIANLCQKLDTSGTDDPDDLRKRYLTYLAEVKHEIV